MGRASRRKRERRLTPQAFEIPIAPASRVMTHAIHRGEQEREPAVIYRFFHNPSHADALAAGRVWLSTLETCRGYEDPKQGDPEEGSVHYSMSGATGNSGDKAFELMAERAGIHIGPHCSNISINFCSSVQRLPDAFVLCATKLFEPNLLSDTFGMHCVAISNPRRFCELLTEQLRRVHDVAEVAYGPVIYTVRGYFDLLPPPGPIGFVKPPDMYKDQHEFRLLWNIRGFPTLKPFLLGVPDAATLCQRVA